jgi:twitching motility protein PilT
MDFHDILKQAAERKASDIFLKEGVPPALRVNGRIISVDGLDELSTDELHDMAKSVMTAHQFERFQEYHELDIAFTMEGICRFRANFYQQRGTMGIVLRLIPLQVPALDDLNMPPVVKDMAINRQGLILVTGPTGCGKSTTLAAIIDLINSTRRCNIVSIEDPIEFVHQDKKSIINQREIGIDTESFTDALKYVVRQSPDVILIGEMRDPETMNVALAASETGHLVLSTVHTCSAGETIDRIINMFPPHEKPQICLRMAGSLRGIVSQKLIPKVDGSGRVAAVEIMVAQPTVSKLIEEGRTGQLYSAISEGGYFGMQTMNQCLVSFFKQGFITEQEAMLSAGNVTELKQLIRRP